MIPIKLRIWDNAMIYDNFLSLNADPNYVMLWSGLKDKNGREIFDSDIVKWDLHPEGPLPYIYEEKYACFAVIDFYESTHGTHRYPQKIDESRLEVVGNKYENPTLWEKVTKAQD